MQSSIHASLRPWDDSDAAAFWDVCQPAEMRQYMNAGFPNSLSACEKAVRAFASEDTSQQRTRAIVIDGRVVGSVGAFSCQSSESSVAYFLAIPYQRKGIMTVVLSSFCQQIFSDYPAMQCITASPNKNNIASQHTLCKSGFVVCGKEDSNANDIKLPASVQI